jgi:predicted MFS family arabinose efflux permease
MQLIGDRSRRSAHRRRVSLAVSLHGLFFVAAVTSTMIVPLLPALARSRGLSPATIAVILALPSVATLVVSIPAGLVADRFGARAVTLAATVLMCLATVGQASPQLWGLIVGRVAFGVAFGVVWTTGVAWLATDSTDAPSRGLGALVTSSACGMAVGPAIGGTLGQFMGIAAPFLLLGVFSAGIVCALMAQPASAGDTTADVATSLVEAARLAPRQPGVLTGAGTLGIVGAVYAAAQLLVPAQLQADGLSSSAIGLAFSGSAVLYIAVSALVLRDEHVEMTPRATALVGLVLSVSLLPATWSPAPLVVIAALLLSIAPRAIIATTAYPLATKHGSQVGLPTGLVLGLLNTVWAAAMVISPLLAAAVEQAAGRPAGYLSVIIPSTLGASLLAFKRHHGESRRAPAAVCGADRRLSAAWRARLDRLASRGRRQRCVAADGFPCGELSAALLERGVDRVDGVVAEGEA